MEVSLWGKVRVLSLPFVGVELQEGEINFNGQTVDYGPLLRRTKTI